MERVTNKKGTQLGWRKNLQTAELLEVDTIQAAILRGQTNRTQPGRLNYNHWTEHPWQYCRFSTPESLVKKLLLTWS